MNFRERKIAYEQLKGESHLEADKALLSSIKPGHQLLGRKLKPDRLQAEILWELLGFDSVTREMVVKNRRNLQGLTEAEKKEIAEKAGTISVKIHKVISIEEKESLINEIRTLVKRLPAEVSAKMIEFAESIIPDFVQVEEAEQELLEIDLETAKQPAMAKIVRALKLETKDMKGDTLRPVLAEYKTNMCKVDQGNGEMNTPVPADLNTENELVVDEAEKEELKEKVEELEADKEELEEENEELKEKLDEAEAEKKNTPPAKSSPKKKSTKKSTGKK